MPTQEQSLTWLERWDRQQEVYVADREERFAVVADVVASVTARPDPLVVDLGCGPGSLAVRLLDRFPAGRVVAVDADPLLLGLARSAYADRRGLRVVEQDLRTPDWGQALGLDRAADAVVSSTALHWLTRAELQAVYATAARLLAPGGVLVDADHLDDAQPRLSALHADVRHARAGRTGRTGEQWEQWWDAVGRAPELVGLVGERGARPIEHAVPDLPGYQDHVRALQDAGFAEVGTVWQSGDDRVLVALR